MSEVAEEDLIICVACGTQFDDPRQFVPPAGQQWTSLRREQGKYENHWKQDASDPRIWHLYTDPKLGIGERASLLLTPHGNIIWDCFAYLSPSLIDFILSHGPVHAVIISHPHFYTTHLIWARALSCPIYTHAADQQWLSRPDPLSHRRLITTPTLDILPGVTAIQTGGHFPGSMVLHWQNHLFLADSIMTTPAAYTPEPRPQGMGAYSFMWSIPNMVPLGPDDVWAIWKAVRDRDFGVTHGLMMGMDVEHADVKKWVLEGAKRQVRRMGWEGHEILEESVAGPDAEV
ncbi:DNA polymerase epsilon catalytic subunit A [Sphaceloma murrayae]|uniref:DNA polymerase epsilon catalytic subunit A n=1 Tax=Sphaceloma murrayae TaxID=2082308 RepID=A0A2K1QZG9_9PEZI|nr:DNA polymerase epsilon catalytic subunit A [Sphaceloma murrayae]